MVVILFAHGQETWRDEHWVKEISFQVPAYLPDNATSDRYEWNITVMRQTGTKPSGMPEGTPVSPASDTWYFTWTVPPPTPTPRDTDTPVPPPTDTPVPPPTDTPVPPPTDTPVPQ